MSMYVFQRQLLGEELNASLAGNESAAKELHLLQLHVQSMQLQHNKAMQVHTCSACRQLAQACIAV